MTSQDRPIFEIRLRDDVGFTGQAIKVWACGRVEGVDGEYVVINGIPQALARAIDADALSVAT